MQTLYMLANLHDFSYGSVLLCLESFLSLLFLISSGTNTLSSPFTSIILCHFPQSFPYIKQPMHINYLYCALLQKLLLYDLVNFIVQFMHVYFCFIQVLTPFIFFLSKANDRSQLKQKYFLPG